MGHTRPTMRKIGTPIITGRRRPSSETHETGPRVTIPSRLSWKANGLDLLLVNVRAFGKGEFGQLVEEFRGTAAGRKDIHLLMHLKTLALNPRLRWPVELYSSLLRWTASSEKNTARRAEAIWSLLFGRPLPRWYKLEERTDSYALDIRGWKTWYDSLPHHPAER